MANFIVKYETATSATFRWFGVALNWVRIREVF